MNLEKLEHLKEAVKAHIYRDYHLKSRTHLLNSFPFPSYVKRDDELSFGLSGTKLRKYASLIPYLKQRCIEHVVLIGGAYSNNVVSLLQLLNENKIPYDLFLKGTPQTPVRGNFFFTTLLVKEESIYWISNEQWKDVESLAADFAKAKTKEGVRAYVIPEGASCQPALPGLLTLPLDILRNERESGIQFSRLLIDSGTGITAAALLLAFSWIEKPVEIDILLLAETKETFLNRMQHYLEFFNLFLGIEMDLPSHYRLHEPITAKSFGATNQSIFHAIRTLATDEGFFVDPIYGAKLFMLAKSLLTNHRSADFNLIIHSGGALALSGFQHQLLKKKICQNIH